MCVTLRYLASGDSQILLAASYRISPTALSRIIFETCEAIWDELVNNGYMNFPKSEVEWENVAKEFQVLWDFPNCLGAIDGKHIMMQAPNNSGSYYFNYKKLFSVVLLGVCDSKYRFTLVDIGQAGRISDGGVFSASNIGEAMKTNSLNIPEPTYLPNTGIKSPYVFVADEAFKLETFMIKPYPKAVLDLPKRICNYLYFTSKKSY